MDVEARWSLMVKRVGTLRPWARWLLVLGLLVTLVPIEAPDTLGPWSGPHDGVSPAPRLVLRGPSSVAPVPSLVPPPRRSAPLLEAPIPLHPPYFDWPHGGAPLGTTLDRVRDDIGVTVTPADFDQGLRSTVQWYGTPFGQDLHLNLFLQWEGTRWAVSLWNQISPTAYYPGLDVRLVEVPLTRGPHPILFSPRLGAWTQPTVQGAAGSLPAWGVLGSAVVEVPLDDNLWVWIEGDGKTAGWIPGGDTDAPVLTVRTGLHWSL